MSYDDSDGLDDSSSKFFIFEKYRLASFKFWPFEDTEICNKASMAKAGFYWTGSEQEQDSAKCFVCGKQLDNWESEDDPWYEHKKHAPNCTFVKLGLAESHLMVRDFLQIFMECGKDNINRFTTNLETNLLKEVERARESIVVYYKR